MCAYKASLVKLTCGLQRVFCVRFRHVQRLLRRKLKMLNLEKVHSDSECSSLKANTTARSITIGIQVWAVAHWAQKVSDHEECAGVLHSSQIKTLGYFRDARMRIFVWFFRSTTASVWDRAMNVAAHQLRSKCHLKTGSSWRCDFNTNVGAGIFQFSYTYSKPVLVSEKSTTVFANGDAFQLARWIEYCEMHLCKNLWAHAANFFHTLPCIACMGSVLLVFLVRLLGLDSPCWNRKYPITYSRLFHKGTNGMSSSWSVCHQQNPTSEEMIYFDLYILPLLFLTGVLCYKFETKLKVSK